MKKMLKLMGFLLFILFFKNSFSQELLPTKRVTLEMEPKKMIELKITENLSPTIKINEIKQNYPPKNKNEAKKCLPENKVNIPKTNAIKKEVHNENNK